MSIESISLHPKIRKVSSFSIEGQTYELECLENIAAITPIEESWNALERDCLEDFTFFQNYNWCLEYYTQFADDLNDKDCPIPQIFVLKQEDKPIMIWPMMRLQSRVGLKILCSASEPLGQYCNLLFHPSKFNAEIGKKVVQGLMQSSLVDTLSLNFYPQGGILDAMIADQGMKEKSEFASSILDITRYKNWNDYYTTLTKSQRKNRRRHKKKIEAEGDVTYKVHEAGTQEYSKLITLALEMKTRWLKETGRSAGLIGDKSTLEMFKNLQMTNSPNNNKEIGAVAHALYLGDHPIAIEMGMIKAKHYYSYLGAMDWAFKDLGPGKVQLEMAFNWAFENNMETFDLFHDPSAYKESWVNHKHPVKSTNIPLTKKGYTYVMLWKTYIRPKLKSVYHFAGNNTRNKINKFFGFMKNR